MLVEGDEDGVLADGEAEQEGVGDLAVADKTPGERLYEFEPGWSHW